MLAGLGAIFRPSRDSPKGTALQLGFKSSISKPVFHLEVDRAAQRIQSKYRIVRPHIGSFDGVRGNQIPIHGIPESLVQPDPAHIDGKALWAALQGGRGETTIIELLRGSIAIGIR